MQFQGRLGLSNGGTLFAASRVRSCECVSFRGALGFAWLGVACRGASGVDVASRLLTLETGRVKVQQASTVFVLWEVSARRRTRKHEEKQKTKC